MNDMAKYFGVSKRKLHRMKKEGVIKCVSNPIKPLLTEKKKDRLKWCLSMLDPRSVLHDPMFKGLFDYVFIDEKWFYLTTKTEKYYTVPDEEQPTRTCKNKNYIPKIMILTVVDRPRFDSDGNCTFDGKIGCFAFVTYEPTKRSSVNRPAGTMEMKPIESITMEVIQSFMIKKVLPAIRAKWPREDSSKPICIYNKTMPSLILRLTINYFVRLLSKMGLTSESCASRRIHQISTSWI
uniref:Transposase n=1 Tax=Arundo donax TaxID=35708 RepID=A0A0A9CC03_ARUDO